MRCLLVKPLRLGAGCQGNQPKCWNFQAPPLLSLRRQRGWRLSLITNGESIIPTWWNLPKNPRVEFGELPVCWALGGAGWWGAQRGQWKLHTPSPLPCPVHLLHLAVPELYPFIKKSPSNVVSKLFSWVLGAILANYWTWPIYSQLVRT